MGELINLNSSVPLMDADIPATVARDSEVTSAIASHIASDHASSIPLGTPTTISVSSIADALQESYKFGFFAESHYLSSGGNGVFATGSSNGGFAHLKAEPGYPGILGLSTGSASNGSGSSATGMGNNSSGICLADGSSKYLGIIKIPVLRDPTNDYVVEIGFQSAGTSIGLDACCFVYDGSSANWQFHTRNNSDLSILITAIPVIANTWYKMEIIIANQVATFSINGTTQTTGSKLPLATRMVGAGIDIRKISGTTGRDILIDCQQVSQKRAENSTTIPISTRTLVDSDIPAAIARGSEVADAIAAHSSAVSPEPHPMYLNQTRGDARYRQSAVPLADADIPSVIARDTEVSAAIAAHSSAISPEPHSMYLTQARGDARYPVFKRSKFTVATPSAQGGTNSIPHRLNVAKILSFSAFVTIDLSTSAGFVPVVAPGGLPGFTGYYYSVWLDTDWIYCKLSSTDSSWMLSRALTVTIDWVQ